MEARDGLGDGLGMEPAETSAEPAAMSRSPELDAGEGLRGILELGGETVDVDDLAGKLACLLVDHDGDLQGPYISTGDTGLATLLAARLAGRVQAGEDEDGRPEDGAGDRERDTRGDGAEKGLAPRGGGGSPARA